MLDRLREFLNQHELIPTGSRVLVGYSGGTDSTCLLHLLHRLDSDVVAAHLNHAQRPEANEEAERCGAWAEALGVPFVGGRADVPELSKTLGIGLEEAGRRARYEFFEQAARQTGCARIATAHTRSDQLETVVLNVTRGSGLSGLAGIPVARGSIIRPLLFAGRAETKAYCESFKLETLHDPGNDDLCFARVRMRKLVVPELVQINERVEDSVFRLSQIVEQEDRFLDGAAAAGLERAEEPLNGPLRFLTLEDEAALRIDALIHLPSVLLRRGVRLLAEALGGGLDYSQTEAVASGLLEKRSGSITAEGGQVTLAWADGRLQAYRRDEEEPRRGPVSAPGSTVSPARGWRFDIRLEEGQVETPRRDALSVPIDIDAFRGPLHYRPAKPGEEMVPIGGTGSRKVSDLLSESGLTLLARRRLPILCDIIGPLWAPGVTLAERARPAAGSGRYLRAEFGPIRAERANSETDGRAETYANSE